jgi:hypothetical protein
MGTSCLGDRQDNGSLARGPSHWFGAAGESGRQLRDPVASDLDGLGAGSDGGNRFGKRVSRSDEQRCRTGDREIELHRTSVQRRIQWYHHTAGMQNTVEHHRELGSVGQHDAHPIAWPQATMDEVVSEPGDIVAQ